MIIAWTVCFLLAVCVFQLQSVLPSAFFLVPLVLILFSLCWLRARPWRLLVALGLGWTCAWGHALHATAWTLPEKLQGEDLIAEGYIASIPQTGGRRMGFDFLPTRLKYKGRILPVDGRFKLNWYRPFPKELKPGEYWRLRVRLKCPHGMMNPGAFDYETALFTQGIRARGYVRKDKNNKRLQEAGAMPLLEGRAALRDDLQQALGEEHGFGGIIQALAIGERQGITDEQWQVLRRTGTTHLMAISGLHVGIVAGLAFILLHWPASRIPRLPLYIPAVQIGAVAAIAAALVYAAMAGFSVPTQRAFIMVSVAMLALLWRRHTPVSVVLCMALITVLLVDPLAVLSGGFWLSFLAVAVIIYVMHERLGEGDGRAGRWWWRWGRIQWYLTLGLAPVVVLYFQESSISSPLANLVAVPWMGSLVVPLVLAGTLLLKPWPWLGGMLLKLAAILLEWLWAFLEFLAENIPVLHLPAPSTLVMACAVLGLLWLFMPRGWPLRSLGLILLLPLFIRGHSVAPGSFKATLLDVGQGLAVVVQTHSKTLVFDTGPQFSSGFNTGDAVVLPYLRSEGIGQLDALVLSHGDNDHFGGARALSDGMAVEQIWTSVPQMVDWAPIEPCETGQWWQWDGVHFEFLFPQSVPFSGKKKGRGNNGSCVLRVSNNGGSLLIPGDIERLAESSLLRSRGEQLKTDVLIAPHHGSKSSSSPAFLEQVSPDWIWLPTGYLNRYGFPHEIVLERYRQRGIQLLGSPDSGAISMLFRPDGMDPPQAYRPLHARYWHNVLHSGTTLW